MCVFVISGRKGNVSDVFKGFTIFIDVLKGIENTKEIQRKQYITKTKKYNKDEFIWNERF